MKLLLCSSPPDSTGNGTTVGGGRRGWKENALARHFRYSPRSFDARKSAILYCINEDKLEKCALFITRSAIPREYANDETAVPIIIFRLFEKEKG
jgi:hypothetical protein